MLEQVTTATTSAVSNNNTINNNSTGNNDPSSKSTNDGSGFTFVGRFNFKVRAERQHHHHHHHHHHNQQEESCNQHHQHTEQCVGHHQHDNCCEHKNGGEEEIHSDQSCSSAKQECKHEHHHHHHHHHHDYKTLSVLVMGHATGSISLFAQGASSLHTEENVSKFPISNILKMESNIISDIDQEYITTAITKKKNTINSQNFIVTSSGNGVKFWKIEAKEKQGIIGFKFTLLLESVLSNSKIVSLHNSHDLIIAIAENGTVGVWKINIDGQVVKLSLYNFGRIHKVVSVCSSRKDRVRPNAILAYSYLAVAFSDGMIGIYEPDYDILRNDISKIGVTEEYSSLRYQLENVMTLRMIIHAFENFTWSGENLSFEKPFNVSNDGKTYELCNITLPENNEQLYTLIKRDGDYVIKVFNSATYGKHSTVTEFTTEAMAEGVHSNIFDIRIIGGLLVVSSGDLVEVYNAQSKSSKWCSLLSYEEEDAQECDFGVQSISFDGKRALLLGCTDSRIRGIVLDVQHQQLLGMNHIDNDSHDLETFEVDLPTTMN